MKSSNSNTNKKKQSQSVADQPGNIIFFVGLSLALLFGVLFRGFFSDERVLQKVTMAAHQIHKDVHVQIGSASLSLSLHGIPRLAVIVKNIRLSSSNNCWYEPDLTLSQLTVPLSLSHLLGNENSLVDRVEIDQAELDISPNKKSCNEVIVGSEDLKTHSAIINVGPTPIKIQKDGVTEEGLKQIEIKDFSIVVNGYNSRPIHFSDLSIQVKSDQPKIIVLKSNAILSEEENYIDYSSKAEINLEYNEFPEKMIIANVFGQFREGHFSFLMQNRLDEKNYNLDFELKHLPLNKIYDLAHQFNMANQVLPRQLWLSLKMHSRGLLQNILQQDFEVKDVEFEGDVGRLEIESVVVNGLNPIGFKPFIMNVKTFNITKLASYFQNYNSPPSLAELGFFTGRVEVLKPNEFRVFGLLKGLEFVFSGQGERQNQKVNQVSLDMNLKNKIWDLKLSRFELDQGVMSGEAHLQADADFKLARAQLDVDQLLLSPEVQRVLTRGGRLESIKMNSQLVWKDQKLSQINGQMNIDHIEFKNFKLSNANFKVKTLSDLELDLQSNIGGLSIKNNFIEEYLTDWKSFSWVLDQDFTQFQNLSGVFSLKDKSLFWKALRAQLNKSKIFFQSSGNWNHLGEISGELSGGQRKWMISGNRNAPIFSLKNEVSNSQQ